MKDRAFFNIFVRDRVNQYMREISEQYDGFLMSFDVHDRKWVRWGRHNVGEWTVSLYRGNSTSTGVGTTFVDAVEDAMKGFA